jgi:hypothetical protein
MLSVKIRRGSELVRRPEISTRRGEVGGGGEQRPVPGGDRGACAESARLAMGSARALHPMRRARAGRAGRAAPHPLCPNTQRLRAEESGLVWNGFPVLGIPMTPLSPPFGSHAGQGTRWGIPKEKRGPTARYYARAKNRSKFARPSFSRSEKHHPKNTLFFRSRFPSTFFDQRKPGINHRKPTTPTETPPSPFMGGVSVGGFR